MVDLAVTLSALSKSHMEKTEIRNTICWEQPIVFAGSGKFILQACFYSGNQIFGFILTNL